MSEGGLFFIERFNFCRKALAIKYYNAIMSLDRRKKNENKENDVFDPA